MLNLARHCKSLKNLRNTKTGGSTRTGSKATVRTYLEKQNKAKQIQGIATIGHLLAVHLHKKARCNKLTQEFKDTKCYYKGMRKGCGREEPWVRWKRIQSETEEEVWLGCGRPKVPNKESWIRSRVREWWEDHSSIPGKGSTEFCPGQLEKTKGSKVLVPTQEWVHLKGRDVFRPLNSQRKWGPTGKWWQQETQEHHPGLSWLIWSDYQV